MFKHETAKGPYQRQYYLDIDATSTESAKQIVPIVVELLHPKRVVDVGCGIGSWLSVFVELGITDVLGIDGPWVEQELLRIPRERFAFANLTEPLKLGSDFDLALCLEVMEHPPEKAAETALDSIVQLAPAILFSAAIPHQGGVGHVNEQWPEYWAERFRQRGFVPVDCIRPRVWRNNRVAWWYAQNTLLFVKPDLLHLFPSLRPYASERLTQMLSVVHPENYLRFTVSEPQSLVQETLNFVSRIRGLLRRWVLPSENSEEGIGTGILKGSRR